MIGLPCGGRPSVSTAFLTFLDEVQRTAEESYPPYNIERLDENRFQISVALAGFTPDEVALTVEQNILTLEGRKSEKDEKTFLHRGISARNFKRQFTLADHVQVRRPLRERPARHRPAAGDSRGDEAAPHRDQRRGPGQRHPDRNPRAACASEISATAARLRGGYCNSSTNRRPCGRRPPHAKSSTSMLFSTPAPRSGSLSD